MKTRSEQETTTRSRSAPEQLEKEGRKEGRKEAESISLPPEKERTPTHPPTNTAPTSTHHCTSNLTRAVTRNLLVVITILLLATTRVPPLGLFRKPTSRNLLSSRTDAPYLCIFLYFYYSIFHLYYCYCCYLKRNIKGTQTIPLLIPQQPALIPSLPLFPHPISSHPAHRTAPHRTPQANATSDPTLSQLGPSLGRVRSACPLAARAKDSARGASGREVGVRWAGRGGGVWWERVSGGKEKRKRREGGRDRAGGIRTGRVSGRGGEAEAGGGEVVRMVGLVKCVDVWTC